ncbi:MAG: hypothetical protein ABWZ85_06435 [Luteibacter sp.]
MKFETFLLKSFFVAVVFTCVLTFGAMLTTSAPIATPSLVAAAR